ncbi:WecB/TagA/CpsF family glycosyltransferase [Cyanobacterium aponinum UTEX 3221]|uniref:Glycosyl transferase, WecB/TagA/CpsF family n=2 Tax=Cyanobacterium aponinum TaxID=379064 RepID=K9Z6T5_CYAAP|nr:WecB/TagA/CpsF family glycosyltransferase [Cyanobacterium aponinum]AFZ54270.1 glycosyl transferase, WecB/TagA/CpsF family [Cyanobacterium aponinum PCC 10605]MBD2393878.1 WecB/TagA/CpsF family glycosyltransferase [Cyanobacterium aponinum FACHB-4101]MTF39583.1 WecB/TagA/CpsF family glycosyltransferase [Cyanobacterium aponinum 0216]WRL37412.1 WecB/TagA/CpsF family glycosyltransferase [Cyanobacterium aponinum UTEX 3221]
MKTFPVLGLPIHLSENYQDLLISRVENNTPTHVVTMNSEMAMMAQKNTDLATAINKADLVVPDGSGVIFYLKRRGQKQQRIAGIELAASLIEAIGKKGKDYPICFYGGAKGVSEKAAQAWKEKVTSAHIIYNHGYLSGQELDDWCETIKKVQPKLILVGLGVPRQELWIMNHRHLAPNAVWIGVGGSFDIWGGVKERAPEFFCNNHLEWLYRLYQEPSRWRRMLALPRFFIKAMI